MNVVYKMMKTVAGPEDVADGPDGVASMGTVSMGMTADMDGPEGGICAPADIKKNKDQMVQKMVHDVKEFIMGRKEIQTSDGTRKEQCIVYIQDKQSLRKIEEELEREAQDLGEDPGNIAQVISADISHRKKVQIEDDLNKKDAPPVILMTSSGARGLSFRYVTRIMIAVPRFSISSALMEIVQVIYRGRGDEMVDTRYEKTLVFYYDVSMVLDPKKLSLMDPYREAAYRKMMKLRATVDAYTMMLLIGSIIETRVYGADQSTGYAVTPLGRQGVSGYHGDSLYEIEKALQRLSSLPDHKIHSSGLRLLCDTASSDNGFKVEFIGKKIDEMYGFLQSCEKRFKEIKEKRGKGLKTQIPSFAIMNGCVIFKCDTKIKVDHTQDCAVKNGVQLDDSLYKEAKKSLREGSRDDQDALDIIWKYVKDSRDLFERRFKHSDKIDKIENAGYIAMPLCAVGRSWNKEEWDQMADAGMDCVKVLYGLISVTAEMDTHLPLDARSGFKGAPYIRFTSGDLERRLMERFVNTELIVSNSVNYLSMLFAR